MMSLHREVKWESLEEWILVRTATKPDTAIAAMLAVRFLTLECGKYEPPTRHS